PALTASRVVKPAHEAGLYGESDRTDSRCVMKSSANISGPQVIKQILRVGLLYFSLVFAIGFVLGTIRTLWIVPNVGPKIAELMEMPVMLLVTILAARWV